MGSSFLTAIHLGLALYCLLNFFKQLVQFGLPNDPRKFSLYLTLFCVSAFFGMQVLTDLRIMDPFFYMRWRMLPVIAGGLGILVQIVFIVAQFSHVQQKIFSRIPLIGALLVFMFSPEFSQLIFNLSFLVSVLYLAVSIKKNRYQKRMFFKMSFFLGISTILKFSNFYFLYVLGELFLFPCLFYFFIFENSLGISVLVEEHKADLGVSV